MKKVLFVKEKVEDAPMGHEIAFGILMAFLVLQPGIWVFLWKCRQHPEEDEEHSSIGSWHEDAMALENLKMFEEMKKMDEDGWAALQDSAMKPAVSPRGGGAVAQVPSSELAKVQDSNDPEKLSDGDSGGSVPDPRGEVNSEDLPAAEDVPASEAEAAAA
jgi:hypothetical protein